MKNHISDLHRLTEHFSRNASTPTRPCSYPIRQSCGSIAVQRIMNQQLDQPSEWGQLWSRWFLTVKWLLVPDRMVRVFLYYSELFKNFQCAAVNLVNDKSQQAMAKLVQGDGKATVTLITTLYNCGDQKSVSECKTHQQQKSKRPQRILDLLMKIRKLRLDWAQKPKLDR